MSKFTLVELGRFERARQSLIFGNPCEIIPCQRGFKLAVFEPEQTLGYERWRANDYGTISWQFTVLRTTKHDQIQKISGVYPGADILFRTRGKDATQRALNWINSIKKKDQIRPNDLPEIAWRRISNQRLLRADFPNPGNFPAPKTS